MTWNWHAGWPVIIILACLAVGFGAWVAITCLPGGNAHYQAIVRQAEADAYPVTRDDLAVSPQVEQVAAAARCGFCDDLRKIGNPDECGCPGPCGRNWCTRLREAERRPA